MSNPAFEASSHAVSIRQAHIKHEASVRSIGSLYLLGTVLLGITAAIGLFNPSQPIMVRLLLSGLFALLACVQLKAGLWLRALDARGRMPATVLSVIGLFGFPIGTLINGYILYLLQSQKGATVFSDEYKQIVAETPDIKYRTSIIVWAFLGLLVLVLAAVVIGAILSRPA